MDKGKIPCSFPVRLTVFQSRSGRCPTRAILKAAFAMRTWKLADRCEELVVGPLIAFEARFGIFLASVDAAEMV